MTDGSGFPPAHRALEPAQPVTFDCPDTVRSRPRLRDNCRIALINTVKNKLIVGPAYAEPQNKPLGLCFIGRIGFGYDRL